MTRKVKIALTITATVVVTAALAVIFLYNPSEVGFFPRCPSKLLTGFDCPGCGSLRGLHALMHGNITAAWGFNPAIFFALALLALIGLAGMTRTTNKPPSNNLSGLRNRLARSLPQWLARLSRATTRITDHPAFPLSILIAIIAWTVFRNL